MPAPDNFSFADVDLDDGWDPMQCYDSTATAASPMHHSTDVLPASCYADLQHDYSMTTPAAAQCTTETWLPRGYSAQPQVHYSSGAPPAAIGPNSADIQVAEYEGLQRFVEYPSTEAGQDSNRGATETTGVKR